MMGCLAYGVCNGVTIRRGSAAVFILLQNVPQNIFHIADFGSSMY